MTITAGAIDWRAYLQQQKIRHVLDVGANIGDTTAEFLALGAERVVALEPNPACMAKLAERFQGDTRVELVPLGASDVAHQEQGLNVFNCWTLARDGETGLDRSLEYGAPFDVSFETLEQVCAARQWVPDFIKIDVDGHEAKVLRGAAELLTTRRPLVLLEVSYLPRSFGDCCECMLESVFSKGYQIVSLLDGVTYRSTRAFMRVFPWDTSFDVFLEPQP